MQTFNGCLLKFQMFSSTFIMQSVTHQMVCKNLLTLLKFLFAYYIKDSLINLFCIPSIRLYIPIKFICLIHLITSFKLSVKLDYRIH